MSIVRSLGLVAQTGYYIKKSWKKNSNVTDLQWQWAHDTLKRFQIDFSTLGLVSDSEPLLLVGNHISYLDIPLLMASVPKVSFVAKKELKSWPIFGAAAHAMNTIFVDRSCGQSRTKAREAICDGLKNGGRIVVFPSGTTTLTETRDWRHGAFEIAKQMGVPVQPFRLTYSPLRTVAYIDDDFFPQHLWKLGSTENISARIEFGESKIIDNPQNISKKWQAWTQEFLNKGIRATTGGPRPLSSPIPAE
jgi:lyso-ornithine lipid O-acyltransferase